MTVKEHLIFYSRIKGVPPHLEEQQVAKAMEEVRLTQFASFFPSRLSGGMRRRLSIAVCLVSEPKIIYLDEPSTGVDPENRR